MYNLLYLINNNNKKYIIIFITFFNQIKKTIINFTYYINYL